jgi:hypothetical protein
MIVLFSVDQPVISEITPNGYSIHQIARNGKTGGGIAVIHKSSEMREILSMA